MQRGEAAGVVTKPNTVEINSDTETLFREQSQQRNKAQLYLHPLTSLYCTSPLHIHTSSFSLGRYSSEDI